MGNPRNGGKKEYNFDYFERMNQKQKEQQNPASRVSSDPSQGYQQRPPIRPWIVGSSGVQQRSGIGMRRVKRRLRGCQRKTVHRLVASQESLTVPRSGGGALVHRSHGNPKRRRSLVRLRHLLSRKSRRNQRNQSPPCLRSSGENAAEETGFYFICLCFWW